MDKGTLRHPGRWHCLFLAPLVLILPALAGCSGGAAGGGQRGLQEQPTPTPIATAVTVAKPVYQVQRGDVAKQLVLSGRIAPVRQADLYFKTGGRIRSVKVNSGDMVKAGQLIAELEMDTVERDLAGSKLDLQRAQVRLAQAQDDLQQSVKAAQANVDIAHENLAIVQAQDPAPRQAQAETALAQADLARRQAQADYDAIAWRNDKAASVEAVSLQRATLTYETAKAAYDLALQDIAAFGHRVAIARRQVDLAQITLDGLARGVDPLLKNDVDRAQFAVDKLQASVVDAQILAPFDGQVQLAFALSAGAPADAFKYLVTVSDLSALEVSADVTNAALDQVSEGMPVTVALVARPGLDLKGHVRRVPPPGLLASTNQERTLRVTVDEPASRVMYANGDLIRVTLLLEQRPAVLWLPPQAIRTFEGRKFVVVQENAGQRRVDIKVGIESESRVEIVSGLTEGQTVVAQ